MKTQIYCRTTDKGVHTFYLRHDGLDYYLFRQDYRRGVNDFFRKGIRLDQAYDYAKAKHDSAIIRTLSKLPSHIRYIENEYGIVVLRKTQRKHDYLRDCGKLAA